MTIKRILVPVMGRDRDRSTLETALVVAGLFDGHVEAHYPKRNPLRNIRALEVAEAGGSYRDLAQHYAEHAEKMDEQARRLFDEVMREAGVEITDGKGSRDHPTASWHNMGDRDLETAFHDGGAYDLVVVGRPSRGSDYPSQTTVEAALYTTGGPVLVAPGTVPEKFCGPVLIGWNRSIESGRAVTNAMPFLERAEDVEIFMVANGVKQGASPQNVAHRLTWWHGISTQVKEIPRNHKSIGEALLGEAAEMGADLLVMGAYTHNRLRERILGGATRFVLEHAELPVLMTH